MGRSDTAISGENESLARAEPWAFSAVRNRAIPAGTCELGRSV